MDYGKKVRYLALSRNSLYIATALPDDLKARYVNLLWECFQKLENGETISADIITEDPFLTVAINTAIEEMVSGFAAYKQRASGNRATADQSPTSGKPMADQRQTEARPMVDQSPTNGKPVADQRPTINNETIYQRSNKTRKERVPERGNLEKFFDRCKGYGLEEKAVLTLVNGYGYEFAQKVITAWHDDHGIPEQLPDYIEMLGGGAA